MRITAVKAATKVLLDRYGTAGNRKIIYSKTGSNVNEAGVPSINVEIKVSDAYTELDFLVDYPTALLVSDMDANTGMPGMGGGD